MMVFRMFSAVIAVSLLSLTLGFRFQQRVQAPARRQLQLYSVVEEKVSNFEDEAVSCSSEGGKWSQKVSDIEMSELSGNPALAPIMSTKESWVESLYEFTGTAGDLLKLPSTVVSIVELCDQIDQNPKNGFLYRLRRQAILTSILQDDRTKYLETVKFLAGRIPREELPNVQGVPIYSADGKEVTKIVPGTVNADGLTLLEDCILPEKEFNDNPLDKFLLGIFRGLVRKEIGWRSETSGIKGLLEEGRHYMLSEEGTPENQHKFVRTVLGGLLTPVLPPFYRIFMAGIVPSKERGDPDWLVSSVNSLREALPEGVQKKLAPGAQLGPLPYAPFLTSVVTPPFLQFLVGPSRVNRRKDGELGGMVVEKCKFLQESGCKGLCLHQCKLPAEQFFADNLGLQLTVSPDFATQSCQWSWGETPLPPSEDPSFPQGCLVGCPTKGELKELKASGAKGLTAGGIALCNA